MSNFYGQYLHGLDEKGRVAIPAAFRANATVIEEKEHWFVTRGFEKCLWVFTADFWKSMLEEKLGGLSMGNKEHRRFIRNFVSPAVEVQADKQGRILLPQNLRQYAELEREVVIAGAVKYLEIWDKTAIEVLQGGDDDQEFTGDFLMDLGL